jgi:hypothetical protein
MRKDYYSILEIPVNSGEIEIHRAYRRLAKKYHPDVNKSFDAQNNFIEITEAYEYLISHIQNRNLREWKDKEYRNNENFEKFREEIRKKAQQQARMRYEEFKKQNQAFQKSGLNDFFLIMKIITRILAILLACFLFILPIYISIFFDPAMILLLLVLWPFAFFIAWFIYDNRKNYFMPGKFYYNIREIKKVFNQINVTDEKCFYIPHRLGTSKPYILELLKVKDIKLKMGGFRQYSANYITEKKTVLIPRSRKAFIVHTLTSAVKILSIVSCIIFFDISSIVWRFIIGLFIGAIIGKMIQLITNTRSNNSYLISPGFLLRLTAWLTVIFFLSAVRIEPFNIVTSDLIYVAVTAIVIFDCLLMQLTNIILGKFSSKPIFKQSIEAENFFNLGYGVYHDIPIISVIYPLIKLITG